MKKLLAVISIATIQSYFEGHKETNVFHFTSDGLAWKEENKLDKQSHISALADKEVITIAREEAAALKEEKKQADEGEVPKKAAKK